MTVIAWDGRYLAADKRATNNGMQRTVTKVFKLFVSEGLDPLGNVRKPHFVLVGVSGSYDFCLAMVDWVRKGRKVDEFPASQLDNSKSADIIVVDGGRLMKYEQTPYPIIFEDEFWAMGSGRDFAMAAMHLGKSASEAVEIACIYQTDCGNGINFVTLEAA